MDELFSKKQAQYPWQLELPGWAPGAKKTETKRRADFARSIFEWEKRSREEGARARTRSCSTTGAGASSASRTARSPSRAIMRTGQR